MIVDYIMLLSVKKLMSVRVKRLRLLLGAAAGGLCSFAVLLPPVPFLLSLIMSIGQAFAISALTFAPQGMRRYIKASLLLFTVSFVYSGFMTAILMLMSPKNMTVRNGSVYIGISPFVLIGLTLICYALMRIICRLTRADSIKPDKCRVVICSGTAAAETEGIVDTGNTLHEPFSGECVIVGNRELFGSFPELVQAEKQESGMLSGRSIRLVPYRTIEGEGLLPAFKPEKITVISGGRSYNVSAYVALNNAGGFTEDCGAVVPAELIMKGS